MQRQLHYLEECLQKALINRDEETALYLIDRIRKENNGPRLDATDDVGQNFLHLAIKAELWVVTEYLLDLQTNMLNLKLELDLHADNKRAYPILYAVRHSANIACIKRLLFLSKNAERNSLRAITYLLPDINGITPLHEAAAKDRFDVICELLELISCDAGAVKLVNHFSINGSPLHVACGRIEHNIEIIATLINRNANLLLPNLNQLTPIQLIIQFPLSDIRRLFNQLTPEKRKLFIALYRAELLKNPAIDKQKFSDLTLNVSLKAHLLAQLEFSSDYSHLLPASPASMQSRLQDAFYSMSKIPNLEDESLAANQAISQDIRMIRRLYLQLHNYHHYLTHHKTTDSFFYFLLEPVALMGISTLILTEVLGIISYFQVSDNKIIAALEYAGFAALAGVEIFAIVKLFIHLDDYKYLQHRSHWQAITDDVDCHVLQPLRSRENITPAMADFRNQFNDLLDAFSVIRMPIDILKTQVNALKNLIASCHRWMLLTNSPFSLFSSPPATPSLPAVLAERIAPM